MTQAQTQPQATQESETQESPATTKTEETKKRTLTQTQKLTGATKAVATGSTKPAPTGSRKKGGAMSVKPKATSQKTTPASHLNGSHAERTRRRVLTSGSASQKRRAGLL